MLTLVLLPFAIVGAFAVGWKLYRILATIRLHRAQLRMDEHGASCPCVVCHPWVHEEGGE